jgi:4-hydroxybenzoate polyprenyltransferase
LINKLIRDIDNFLLYGGAYIGLCAASITGLTFELIGSLGQKQLAYTLLIGSSTASLYSAHRVLGLRKLSHIRDFERYDVIRKYKSHIWVYCILWTLISVWLLIPLADLNFILWLIPGGTIAVSYVVPTLSKGRRLRDLGWMKIILIGWSWAWLTAFIPALYIDQQPTYMAVFIGLGRMLFIIALTIPFEIRDVRIDASVGVITMPIRFGLEHSVRIGIRLCLILMLFFLINAIHYHDWLYGISMMIVSFITMWILKNSKSNHDDYFFSGLTDGLMIFALVLYWMMEKLFL